MWELREGLRKRGESWHKWPDEDSTTWQAYSNPHTATESMDGTLIVTGLTPAQAIAATLSAGTCHYIPDDVGFTWWDENDVEHCEEYSASYECGSASCDKCGYTMMVGDGGWFDGWDEITEWWEEDGSYHKGYVLRPRFKHCPNCGCKVVDE